jgi:hypothetical protein
VHYYFSCSASFARRHAPTAIAEDLSDAGVSRRIRAIRARDPLLAFVVGRPTANMRSVGGKTMNAMRRAGTHRNSKQNKRPDEQNAADTGRYGRTRPHRLDIRRSTCTANHLLFHSCCKVFDLLKTACLFLFSFWHHFHPILHQLGAKGDLKINKNNNKLKTCKPNYKKVKNRNFFECVAILLKTGGLNGCTFTIVL